MEPDNEIEEIEIRLFLEAVNARYGYDLREYLPTSMRRRVLAALAKSGLSHLGELQHRVLTDPDFFARVLEDLTVRVSELFRDPAFHRAYRERVIPILRTYPQLKMWHAGCATGEEVYSNAISLTEEGLYDRTQIYATDLSSGAVEQAKQGLYSMEHATGASESYEESGGTAHLSDYYTAAYDRIAMREALKKNVLFFQHNLVSDFVFGEMQVVFCRNVLIYFDAKLRERVLGKISKSLCAGGFLCLGSSEQLVRTGASRAFIEFDGEARIYRHAA